MAAAAIPHNSLSPDIYCQQGAVEACTMRLPLRELLRAPGSGPEEDGAVAAANGFHPAMTRAHSRACRLSVMPGNSRRSSIAADSSPPRWKAMRIATASASETTNIR
jgi:hypothetical protein